MIDVNKLESELLLKLYYDKYEIEGDYNIITENKIRYVILKVPQNLSNSKIYKFTKIDNLKYRIDIDEEIYNTDSAECLKMFKLNKLETLFLLSMMLGNDITKKYIPDKLRDKLYIKPCIPSQL